MVIFAVWLSFDCFWRMVHCTNHQKHSKPLVYQSSQVYQDCTNSVPTVYQSSKTVKRQSKEQKWLLVYQSSQVYQDCTNSVTIVYQSSKTVKQQKMTIGVPIVTCLHRVRRIHKVRVVGARRIHKAVCVYQQCCHLANGNKTCPSLLVFKNMARGSQGFVMYAKVHATSHTCRWATICA